MGTARLSGRVVPVIDGRRRSWDREGGRGNKGERKEREEREREEGERGEGERGRRERKERERKEREFEKRVRGRRDGKLTTDEQS